MYTIVSNWKMAPEKKEQVDSLITAYKEFNKKYKKTANFIVCPPALFAERWIKKAGTIPCGIQRVASDDAQAQTGMMSATMAKSVGIKYALVGHSEVRAKGETNEDVAKQIGLLLKQSITPIVCIGEKQRDKDGWYISEIKDQIEILAKENTPKVFSKIVIAYEPVWAIGAGATREATVEECHEVLLFIRKVVSDSVGPKVGNSITLLYGGSVNETNAKRYLSEGGAQGLLIGRTGLDAKKMKQLLGSLI
jgi:triosephosphate isomerase (TIM)